MTPPFTNISGPPGPLRRGCQRLGLLAAVIGIWLLIVLSLLPLYSGIARNVHDPLIGVAASVTIIWLNFIALFAVYHTISFLGSLFVRAADRKPAQADISANTPSVAVLCPCMNDLDELAFRSCLDLQYGNFSVFILDDSTNIDEIRRVDEIQRLHPTRVRVIRRELRIGFKGGNLNHAINEIGADFDYFCIVDADERLPANFLARSVSIAEADPRLGFVQAAHRTYFRTPAGDVLGGGLLTHWDYFLPIRNYSGFQCFIGHGALLRAAAVRSVGGFDHVLAEDLDIATRMRMKGYRGYFDFGMSCVEAAPDDYNSFRIRSAKILTGTLEFLWHGYPKFARCKDVPLGERIDVLFSAVVVLLPILFVIVLGLLFIAIPSLYVVFGGSVSHYAAALHQALAPADSFAFALFVSFTILAPNVYTIPDIAVKPARRLVKALSLGTVHLTLCIPSCVNACHWLFTGERTFVATRDRSKSGSRYPNGRVALLLEWCCVVVGIAVGSVPLLAIGATALLLPSLYRQRNPRTVVSAASCLVYLAVLSASIGDPVAAAVAAGACSSLACLHH
jgi:cellulose synthase/poly-beta-1,6-N-acetylglucosamine synthase-like glycosyltransferase